LIDEGSPAPDFTLTSDAGERVRLSQFQGRPAVLYFYPNDDTPRRICSSDGIVRAFTA
jgi:peroxiredoxin Q/BCP